MGAVPGERLPTPDVPQEVEQFENGRDFLACCDVNGSSLQFGAWWHKRGSGCLGAPSFDICDDAYQQLPTDDRAKFVRIDSMRDVVEHMGLPSEAAEQVDLVPTPPAIDVGADVQAAEVAIQEFADEGR